MPNKLIGCYPADGMMWCKLSNGKSIPPFPLSEDYKKKTPKAKAKGGFKKSR